MLRGISDWLGDIVDRDYDYTTFTLAYQEEEAIGTQIYAAYSDVSYEYTSGGGSELESVGVLNN